MVSPPAPILVVCDVCSSTDVSCDAWVQWDTPAQDWVLHTVFDFGYCHQCDAERTLGHIAMPVGTS